MLRDGRHLLHQRGAEAQQILSLTLHRRAMDAPPYVEVDRPPTSRPPAPAPSVQPRRGLTVPLTVLIVVIASLLVGAQGFVLSQFL